MKKTNKKKIAAVLAAALSLTMLAAGCGKKEDDSDELVTNVITQAEESSGSAGSETQTSDGSEAVVTETVLDDEGNVVTDAGGAPVTQTQAVTAAPEGGVENVFENTTAKPKPVVDSSVDSSTRYVYNTLTEDEQKLYDAIVGAASNMSTRIYGTNNLDSAEWSKIFGLVYNQEPQLFWLSTKSVVGRIYYLETDTEKIASMQKEIDATVDSLIREANSKSTTYEKLLVFHDYLVLNSTFEKNSGTAGSFNQTIYNAFAGGTSSQGNIQCSGYAKAMQYLCDKAGIDCMVIVGTNDKDLSHAWNKVKVEGEWYNLDCTWDDPILTDPVENYLRYNYFLVPDEWINNKTHFNVNKVTLKSGKTFTYYDPPKATSDSLNYFVKNGYVYKDFDSADKALKAALEDAASKKGAVAHIMVDSDDIYKKITSDLAGYQKYIKEKNSAVSALTSNCNPNMRLIQLDLKY